MKYRESEEMYLETILILQKKQRYVRSIDVANTLNYSRASVSRAINLLKDREYIEITKGLISFTDRGLAKANEIYECHKIITNLLMKIGAPEEIAEDNACRIEHVITLELIDYFKKYIDNNN